MDVVIVLGDYGSGGCVGLAKQCLAGLGRGSLTAVVRASGDDHRLYELTEAEASAAAIIAIASPGASFPSGLAAKYKQLVVLIPSVDVSSALAAAAAASVLATGSAGAPLARVGVNNVDEAVAVVQRLLCRAAGPQTPADKQLQQAVCQSDLDVQLGRLGPVEAAQQRTTAYLSAINAERLRLGAGSGVDRIAEEALPGAARYFGKVRDMYILYDRQACVMVATGRQSAFDRQLASIPFKGDVLNLISLWWFEATNHITPNHVICSPHSSVVVGEKCTIFPVEFVVRGYVTGSTDTSMWTHYKNGARQYCGHDLPEGMVKNQKLWCDALVTPTTKDKDHDRPISGAEAVSEGRLTQSQWDHCERVAKELFLFGQRVARERGLILVDTKYEFGVDSAGNILLCDEIHTPDSSRYWLAESYEARFAVGQEPENIDKEFLRRWFRARCDPYKDEVLPEAPEELVCELSRRYILLFELITGQRFDFPASSDGTTRGQEISVAVTKAFQAGLVTGRRYGAPPVNEIKLDL
uniref:phosphoribosylaminoimidazolesuccinocarboxamide synthase n=1 Tax=Rhizochromulina marina TaxID=1034831 RepID=A0A7S2RK64_9STRA